MKYFLRFLKGVFVTAVVLVAAIAFFAYQQETERKRMIGSIEISVRSGKECPSTYPLVATITNRYEKTLKHLKFEVEIYEPGSSKNLNAEQYNYYDFDTILKPNESARQCYAFPPLERKPASTSIIIRGSVPYAPSFYEPGEFVPASK